MGKEIVLTTVKPSFLSSSWKTYISNLYAPTSRYMNSQADPWNNTWLGVDSPELQRNVWKSPQSGASEFKDVSIDSPNLEDEYAPQKSEIELLEDEEKSTIEAKSTIDKELSLSPIIVPLAVKPIDEPLENVWAESGPEPIIYGHKEEDTREMDAQDEMDSQDETFSPEIPETSQEEIVQGEVAVQKDESIPEVQSPSGKPESTGASENEACSEAKEDGDQDDDFGDFEEFESSGPKIVEAFPGKTPYDYVDELYDDNETKPPVIEYKDSLLDYGQQTRRYFNAFTRPTRQFHIPESVPDNHVLRWHDSDMEKELEKRLKEWEKDDLNGEEKSDSKKSDYVSMFGWATSVDDNQREEKPRKITMREKLEKKAAKLADSLVNQRLERERREEAERRAREAELAKLHAQKVNQEAKNTSEAKEDETVVSHGTLASNIFSPFNNIFKFQKLAAKQGALPVKLSSKAARNIKKSKIDSRDFFKDEKKDENEKEGEVSDDGFGDFVFKSTGGDEDEDESDDNEQTLGYANIGDEVAVAGGEEDEEASKGWFGLGIRKEFKGGKKGAKSRDSINSKRSSIGASVDGKTGEGEAVESKTKEPSIETAGTNTSNAVISDSLASSKRGSFIESFKGPDLHPSKRSSLIEPVTSSARQPSKRDSLIDAAPSSVLQSSKRTSLVEPVTSSFSQLSKDNSDDQPVTDAILQPSKRSSLFESNSILQPSKRSSMLEPSTSSILEPSKRNSMIETTPSSILQPSKRSSMIQPVTSSFEATKRSFSIKTPQESNQTTQRSSGTWQGAANSTALFSGPHSISEPRSSSAEPFRNSIIQPSSFSVLQPKRLSLVQKSSQTPVQGSFLFEASKQESDDEFGDFASLTAHFPQKPKTQAPTINMKPLVPLRSNSHSRTSSEFSSKENDWGDFEEFSPSPSVTRPEPKSMTEEQKMRLLIDKLPDLSFMIQ